MRAQKEPGRITRQLRVRSGSCMKKAPVQPACLTPIA
jgi:hypothetical protein